MNPSAQASTLSSALCAHPAAFAYHLSKGKWIPALHLQLISFHLARAAAGRGKRILIATPPRHGKSLLTSVWAPAWFLSMWPHKRVILTSYEASVASDWGRQVRNLLDDHQDVLGVRLAKDSKAANRWNTDQGGGMVTAGVGGPITGRGADLFLVDDPVKNTEQANSVVDRNKKDEWWKLTARTRLEPGASVVMIQTRWHEDDLMGRRLKAREAGNEQWHEIRLPAYAEKNDPLGRPIGAPLWPERYDTPELEDLKRDVGTYGWGALFQQNPLPAEGGIFKEHWFEQRYHIDRYGQLHIPGTKRAVPVSACLRFATVDPAIKIKELTEEDAFTVIITWGVAPSGHLLVLDVRRDHFSSPETVREMQSVNRTYKPTAFWIEKVAYQSALIQWGRAAGRLPCRELEADNDKATRAMGAAPSCEAGKVLMPYEAPWLLDLMRELLAAPTGTFWDQVDAFSYGVKVYDQHSLISWPLWGESKDSQRDGRGTDVGGARHYPEDDYDADLQDDAPPKHAMDGLGPSRGGWRGMPW